MLGRPTSLPDHRHHAHPDVAGERKVTGEFLDLGGLDRIRSLEIDDRMSLVGLYSAARQGCSNMTSLRNGATAPPSIPRNCVRDAKGTETRLKQPSVNGAR